MNKAMRVGFIGLGLMGKPMAKNIFQKGFKLAVYNRNPERTKEFGKLGAKVCKSSKEVAGNSDVVITMVTGPKDVRQVCLGRNGIAEGGKKGLVVIDMSTIGPNAAKEIASDLANFGIDFIDAPVTGGTTGAEKGTLTIFIGGEEMVYKRVKPMLEAMGTDLQYMGKTGFGQAMKLVNNLIVGITTEALAEAFLLSEALGLTKKRTAEALQGVFSVSPGMKSKMPNMVESKFPPSFSVANIRKDLKLAIDDSGKGNKLPNLKTTEKLYKKGMDIGLTDSDLSSIIEVLSKK